MENTGHLEGMLDRDQRTAKLRFPRGFSNSDRQVPKTYSFIEKNTDRSTLGPVINHHYCCPARTKNSLYLTWKSRYLLRNLQSFTNVLIVGIYLTLVTLPSTNSAPAIMDPPKWINPCGINLAELDRVTDNPSSPPNDLNKIVSQANIALAHAESFKEKFIEKTFQKPFPDIHSLLLNQRRWLGIDINKSLTQKVSEDDLMKLKLNDTLLDVYGYLQKIAAGLEQVTLDQKRNSSLFESQFNQTEQELKNVLCEFQMVIIDRGIQMRKDVTRDVLNDEPKPTNTSETNVRDWRVLREYINMLEYVIQVFKYFDEKM